MTSGADRLFAVEPEQALQPGRWDAAALVIVGLLRGAAPMLMVVGLIYALLTVGPHFESVPPINSAAGAFRALLSPFWLVAVAILIRLGTGVLALLLAYPLSRRTTGSTIGPDLIKRTWRVWQDRLHLLRAFRSLRWTSPVRTAAIGRLGRAGNVLSWTGTIIAILFWVAVVGLVAVLPIVARR